MLLVLAALLAAATADAGDAAQLAQAQNGPGRSFTAVRVVPADEAAALAPVADRAPVLSAEQPGASSGWYSLYGGNHFGLLADGGVPGGAGLAGVFRPWQFLRVEGGVNWNYLSYGLRGGVTVIPFEWGITPTLHAEGGHFFAGDASRFTDSAGAKLLLGHVPEDYLSASLGLEFGSQQRFVFFLRAGLSWVRTEASNIAQAIAADNPGSTTTVKSAGNVSILLQVPTVSAGFLLFLF
jgi:opacity protein-like surface antigen